MVEPVLERGSDRGPAAVDLAAPESAARAFVRGRGGAAVPGAPPEHDLPTRHNRRPLAVALGPGGGGVDFDVEVPEGARFQAGVGFRRIAGHRQPDGVLFRVSVLEPAVAGVRARGQDGAFVELASRRVQFGREGRGRTWLPLEADLSAFAGERITLRLEAVPARPPRGRAFALWGGPRIATRP